VATDRTVALPPGRPIVEDRAPALARRLALASVVAVLCAAVCYVVMVRTSLGQRVDNAAYYGAQAQYNSTAAAATSPLRRITADSLGVVLLALVGIGLLRRRFLLGLGAAFAAGIAVVGTDLLKYDVLSRPDLTGLGRGHLLNTFPSGHTATAVGCAMALVLVAPPRWRGVAAVIAGTYGWLTAALVQTAGWHRPSDAIGAAFLAFAAVTAVASLLCVGRPVAWRDHGRHRFAMAFLLLVGIVDGAVCLRKMVGVLRYLRAHALGQPVSGGVGHDAYITGLTITVEVVVVLLMALLALLGGADFDGWGWLRRPVRA
jgi:hypothetical protein